MSEQMVRLEKEIKERVEKATNKKISRQQLVYFSKKGQKLFVEPVLYDLVMYVIHSQEYYPDIVKETNEKNVKTRYEVLIFDSHAIVYAWESKKQDLDIIPVWDKIVLYIF